MALQNLNRKNVTKNVSKDRRNTAVATTKQKDSRWTWNTGFNTYTYIHTRIYTVSHDNDCYHNHQLFSSLFILEIQPNEMYTITRKEISTVSIVY